MAKAQGNVCERLEPQLTGAPLNALEYQQRVQLWKGPSDDGETTVGRHG